MADRLVVASVSTWMKDGLTRDEIKVKLIYGSFNLLCVVLNFSAKTTLQFFGWPLAIAGPIAYLFGGQMNFLFHNFITFKYRHPSHVGISSRWRRFTFGNVGSLLLNVPLLLGLTTCGFGDIPAFVIALCLSGILNWVYNKHVTFARRPLDPPEESVTDDVNP